MVRGENLTVGERMTVHICCGSSFTGLFIKEIYSEFKGFLVGRELNFSPEADKTCIPKNVSPLTYLSGSIDSFLRLPGPSSLDLTFIGVSSLFRERCSRGE